MDTQPLDLSRTCWALTDPAFQREIMFGTAYALARTPEERQGYIAWPWAGKRWHGDAAAQREAYGALLGLDPARAVVIPSVHLSRNPEFENDEAAVSWVNAEYAKAVELAKEEY